MLTNDLTRTCMVSQSTSSCSLSVVRLPVKMALMPSTLPVVEKAQHEPHYAGHLCTIMDTGQRQGNMLAEEPKLSSCAPINA